MVELNDSTRLKLHPLRIAPFGDGNYSVIRRGGREEIATRELGVEALRRLAVDGSIGETRRWLAARHNTSPNQVQLEPLLRVLMKAGMVAEVDGVRLATPRVGLRDVLRFQLRFEVLPRLAKAARRLPVSLARPALRNLFEHELRGPCRGKVSRAGANFQRVVPGVGEKERRSFEERYFDHLVWNLVDLEALRSRPFGEVDKWLETSVRLEGVDLFEEALRQNRGVMLVGYHFGSTRLLPLALMRHGYSLISMGAINIGWGSQKTKEQVAEWRRLRPSYGDLQLVDNLDLGSVNRLVSELRRGGTVLTLPDVYSLSTFEDAAAAERSRFFGIVRPPFRRSAVAVRFFDHLIDVNPWGGWLAAMARPVVLPFIMERRTQQLVCRFGQPFESADADSDGRARLEAVTRELFQRLEQEIVRDPAQWFGWHNLDKLNPRPVREGSAREKEGFTGTERP